MSDDDNFNEGILPDDEDEDELPEGMHVEGEEDEDEVLVEEDEER